MRFLVLARWTKLVIVATVQVAAIKKENNKSALKKRLLKTYAWMFGNAPHNASVKSSIERVNDRGGFGPLTQLMLFYALGSTFRGRIGRPDRRVFVNPNRRAEGRSISLLSKLIALQIGYAMFTNYNEDTGYI